MMESFWCKTTWKERIPRPTYSSVRVASGSSANEFAHASSALVSGFALLSAYPSTYQIGWYPDVLIPFLRTTLILHTTATFPKIPLPSVVDEFETLSTATRPVHEHLCLRG